MDRRVATLGLMLGCASSAWAGNGVGDVGQVAVARQGNQVFVELLNVSLTGWPCATTHPSGFRYAFLLDAPGGKEMLATVLAAKASGVPLQIVDTGVCTIDPSLANVNYIVER